MKKSSPGLQIFMPDTVAISGLWRLKSVLPESWRVFETKRQHRSQEQAAWHAYSGDCGNLTFSGPDGPRKLVTRIECSLPALIHGHNAKLFNSEKSLRRAIEILKNTIDSFATRDPGTDITVCRLDFAWQMCVEAQGVLTAYERQKLKRGRKVPVVYPGESVRWNLEKSCLQLYDKTEHMKKRGFQLPENGKTVLRFELQLRSKHAVAEAFLRRTVLLDDLTLELCYFAFRTFIIERLPDADLIQYTDGKMSRSQLLPLILVLCADAGINIGNEAISHFADRMLAPSARRKLRREVGTMKLAKCNFRPREIFPEKLEDLRGVNLSANGKIEEVSITQ